MIGHIPIPLLISRAAEPGHRIVIWYMGLASPEAHVSRVRARVQRGGHDIPAAKIYERFDRSVENLITLIPCTDELKLFDNSIEVDLVQGEAPRARALLHVGRRKLVTSVALTDVPDWAKPVFAALLMP